jgi:transcription elongation GreA/GreB family factor
MSRETRVRELEAERQTAPLARALLGREAGESVPFQGAEAEIVGIEP